MPKYILTAKEIKTFVGEFDSYEEAKEAVKSLELDDIKTNTNLTYEITLKEDHEQNLLNKYHIAKLKDGKYLGNGSDLRNFLIELGK